MRAFAAQLWGLAGLLLHTHPAQAGQYWRLLAQLRNRQLRARRVSGTCHWQEWREKEPDPSQTSHCSFIITKDVPAALKGFSQKTVSDIRKQPSLVPTYCCNFPRTKLQDITWLQSLSPGHCHCRPPPKKAELASYQCTNAAVQEARALWAHFPWSRAQEVWGLQDGLSQPLSQVLWLQRPPRAGWHSCWGTPCRAQLPDSSGAPAKGTAGHKAVRRPGFLKSFLSFSSNRR